MMQELESLLAEAEQAIAQGEITTAIAHYQQIATQCPAEPEILWRLGLAHLLQGDEAKAQEIWFGAIAQIPADDLPIHLEQLQSLLLATGAQYLHQRRFGQAEAALRHSLELEESAIALANLGSAIAQQGRYEEAVECWRRSLDVDPQQPELCCRWGQMHQALGEWAAAIGCYQRGLAEAPAHAEMWHRLGQCQIRLGQLDVAIASLNAALNLLPDDSAIWCDSGWAQALQINWSNAFHAWAKLPALQQQFVQDYTTWVEQLRQANRDTPLLVDNHALLKTLAAAEEDPAREAFVALLRARGAERWAQALHPSNSPSSAVSKSAANPAEPESMGSVPPPTGYVETTQGWLEQQGLAATHFRPLYPATTLPLSPPVTANTEIHPSFRFGQEVPLPASFVATIPGGRYVIEESQQVAAIAPDNTILGDVSPFSPILSPRHPDAHVSRHPLLQQAALPVPKSIDGTVAILSGLSNSVYFHWMLDVLPRLEMLRQAEVDLATVDYFLVDSDRPFQRQTLERLGIPLEKTLAPADVPHLEARSLLLPSFPASISWMPEWSLDFLRRTFLPCDRQDTAAAPHRRLYITRAKAGVRRLINEAHLIAALEPWGFEVVDLEQFSVVEQAQLFAEAAIILTVHGSGLTNLVFCQPGTTVIELFAPYYVYPCYWLVASWRNLRYSYLLGQTPEGEFLHQLLYPDSRQEDLWIDPAAVIDHLDFLNLPPLG
ncbi:MAG: glycosyltransferase 61 family protein [Cyanobacteria bacterium J06638_22]